MEAEGREQEITIETPIEKIKRAHQYVVISESESLKQAFYEFKGGDRAYEVFVASLNKEVATLAGEAISADTGSVVAQIREIEQALVSLVSSVMSAAKPSVTAQRSPVQRSPVPTTQAPPSLRRPRRREEGPLSQARMRDDLTAEKNLIPTDEEIDQMNASLPDDEDYVDGYDPGEILGGGQPNRGRINAF